MKAFLASVLLAITSFSASAENSALNENMQIVGETEYILVEDVAMNYLARIDTGANSTSIHAIDIEVEGATDDKNMRDHVGKTVHFTTINENDEKIRHQAEIHKVSIIRNAQGEERRYSVVMNLNFNGETRPVIVNLRDRSRMTYKLLIGRNWLRGNYLVDVSKSAH
ncbi:ATP-dependent zinc protease [Thaumasiovibrio subtropicus]|uniref:ATP-dependent zinc protease family protein n=1 Tax=Thaumasiovibrio subtropicus TaxID=1891207 RepID=UPI000B3517C4|nr:RimK/LysX family protein [Thaumasiovibrio subtropicus]